jgi:hypothetical protein
MYQRSPLRLAGVALEVGEPGVVVGGHHVREAQRRDREVGIPAHDLAGEFLFEVLGEGVDALGEGVALLVDRA